MLSLSPQKGQSCFETALILNFAFFTQVCSSAAVPLTHLKAPLKLTHPPASPKLTSSTWPFISDLSHTGPVAVLQGGLLAAHQGLQTYSFRTDLL